MSENQHPEASTTNHLDADDLRRAEENTEKNNPLAANEKDAHIPDSELNNPSQDAKQSAEKNDPTTGHSPTL